MADRLIRTIKAVSKGKLDEGSIGFITKEEENKWYNTVGEPEALQTLMDTIIQKGNSIEFEMAGGFATKFAIKEKAQEQEGSFPDDMTTFEDLLNDAHTKFEDFTIKTQMIENDWEKQRAIFKATVMTGTMNIYEAHGDATQENCGAMVKIHYIRMAETRAIARALRWATNNAKAASEETEHGELSEEFNNEVDKTREREGSFDESDMAKP